MNRIFWTMIITSAALLMSLQSSLKADPTPVMASDTTSGPTSAEALAATPTMISLDGRQIMNIRTGYGDMSAPARADMVRDRLIPILSMRHLQPSDVTVASAGRNQDSTIYVRGHQLITVDRTLASANGMKPLDLANQWAVSLRYVLPKCDVQHNEKGL